MPLAATRSSCRWIAALLVVSLLPVHDLTAQTSAWEAVRDVPQGTRVRLALRDGAEVRGTVGQIADDALSLNIDWMKGGEGRLVPQGTGRVTGAAVTRSLARGDVTTVTVEEMAEGYVADDRPNPATVRHVVSGLGVGQKIRRGTVSGSRIEGRIQSVEDDGFTANADGAQRVPYADVTLVEPKRMSGLTKGLMIGGIVAGALLALIGIQMAACGCLG